MKKSKFPLPQEFRILDINEQVTHKHPNDPDKQWVTVRVSFTVEGDKDDPSSDLSMWLARTNYNLDGLKYEEQQCFETVEDAELFKASSYWFYADEDGEEVEVGSDWPEGQPMALGNKKPELEKTMFVEKPLPTLAFWDPKTNIFCFSNCVTYSPSTIAIINELRMLQAGINFSNTTPGYRLYDLLLALNALWH